MCIFVLCCVMSPLNVVMVLCINSTCLTGFACYVVLCCVYMSPFTVVVLCVCHPLLLFCVYISPLTIALCVYVTLHCCVVCIYHPLLLHYVCVTLHCHCVVHLSPLTVVVVCIRHSLPLDMHCMLLTVIFCVCHCCRYIRHLSCNFSYILFIMILLFSDFCNSAFSVMEFLILN